jgi:ubiquinone/menaquinone biosynthesis C-methylase UbiE
MNFHELSYKLHGERDNRQSEVLGLELYRNWFDRDTIDLWRHLRMFNLIDPLLEEHRGASWLTVGDGSYGTASIYVRRHEGRALPVDINTSLLEEAKTHGLIDEFAHENAEAMSFADDSFDFSLCKESYHHFPRPAIALYEMLRVSRRAVVLIEPADWLPSPAPRRVLQQVKNAAKRKLRKPIPHPDTGNYEDVGNYVYNVSEREIQKIALGMSLPSVAFKRFHDVYVEGVEYERAEPGSKLLRQIKKDISKNELLCRLGLSTENHICAVIFKEPPAAGLRAKMIDKGFDVIDLPKNPYLDHARES